MLNVSKRAQRFLAGAVLAAALSGCATGKLRTYDEKAEADAGAKQDKWIVERSGVSKSTDLSDYVTQIGEKVAAVSDRPELKWKFTVLDSAEPRAFSTRGGHVYITRGMLALLRSENDLAAVLAHEVAHISAHDAQRTENTGDLVFLGNLAAVVAIQPWALLLPTVSFAPGGASMAAYRRHNELNADRRGAEYLGRAGFPKESMPALMEVLVNLDRYQHDHQRSRGRSGGAIFASHPSTEKRFRALGHSGTPVSAAQDSAFLARLEGLAFGSTNRDGFASGSERYFTQLDAMIDSPKGSVARANGDKVWVYGTGHGYMSMERVDPDATGGPCEVLKRVAYGAPLTDIKESDDEGVRSCSARPDQSKVVLARSGAISRIGIVVAKPDGERYLFRIFEAYVAEKEQALLSIARSVKAPGPDRPRTPVVRVRETQEGDTFASLAKTARIPDAEAQLRLLNNCYPRGDLVPGQLVKVIE